MSAAGVAGGAVAGTVVMDGVAEHVKPPSAPTDPTQPAAPEKPANSTENTTSEENAGQAAPKRRTTGDLTREARAAKEMEKRASPAPAETRGEVKVSSSRYPESAGHIQEAQRAGRPADLTIDRRRASSRRAEALANHKKTAGMDRDEYPPAMFEEGGEGASVRPISPGDNRGAGACIGAQCRGLPNGSKVTIKVTP